jgi:hypothetical protein
LINGLKIEFCKKTIREMSYLEAAKRGMIIKKTPPQRKKIIVQPKKYPRGEYTEKKFRELFGNLGYYFEERGDKLYAIGEYIAIDFQFWAEMGDKLTFVS